MPRTKLTDPTVIKRLYLRQTLVAQVELRLMNPMRGRPQYGAWGKLIEQLLTRWLEEEAQAAQQPIFTPAGSPIGTIVHPKFDSGDL